MNPLVLVAALMLATTLPAAAQNKGGGSTGTATVGVITIDQAKAEAGGVTPGDAPGFPVTISQPGSYRLMGNLNLTDASVHAIHITADNVTLDLNGFTVQGPVTCTGYSPSALTCTAASNTGVLADNGRAATVHGGYVRGFQFGVYLSGPGRIEGVHVSDTSERGISDFSTDSHVAGNSVRRSGGGGIAGWGLVRDNSVSLTRAAGIYLGAGALATANRVYYVGGPGIAPMNQGDMYHVAWNAIMNAGSASMSFAHSLGGGNTNQCNGQAC